MIAALFVIDGGCYYGLEGVDPWPEGRDARLYAGPHRVVAHPPCERWGRYWYGGPSAKVRKELGADGGCFEAALGAVRRWGGVLEHPEGSHAWRRFGLLTPPKTGGWIPAGLGDPGWTCCVEQGHYGHRARKATWLYAVGCELPQLRWGRSESKVRLDDGYHTAEERALAKFHGTGSRPGRERRTDVIELLTKRERAATPEAFRDVLVAMARGAA